MTSKDLTSVYRAGDELLRDQRRDNVGAVTRVLQVIHALADLLVPIVRVNYVRVMRLLWHRLGDVRLVLLGLGLATVVVLFCSSLASPNFLIVATVWRYLLSM